MRNSGGGASQANDKRMSNSFDRGVDEEVVAKIAYESDMADEGPSGQCDCHDISDALQEQRYC